MSDMIETAADWFTRFNEASASEKPALARGFRDWIEHDSDLDSLRGLPRYREIMARLDLRKSEAV